MSAPDCHGKNALTFQSLTIHYLHQLDDDSTQSVVRVHAEPRTCTNLKVQLEALYGPARMHAMYGTSCTCSPVSPLRAADCANDLARDALRTELPGQWTRPYACHAGRRETVYCQETVSG